jgi:hypothetical protein
MLKLVLFIYIKVTDITNTRLNLFINFFRTRNSIEVIDINQAWLSNLVATGNLMTSSLVAELPKGLFSATSIVVNNQMIIFGGFSNIQVSNSDIFIFNVDNNNVSTLPSVFASMNFGQKTYLLPKGYF